MPPPVSFLVTVHGFSVAGWHYCRQWKPSGWINPCQWMCDQCCEPWRCIRTGRFLL